MWPAVIPLRKRSLVSQPIIFVSTVDIKSIDSIWSETCNTNALWSINPTRTNSKTHLQSCTLQTGTISFNAHSLLIPDLLCLSLGALLLRTRWLWLAGLSENEGKLFSPFLPVSAARDSASKHPQESILPESRRWNGSTRAGAVAAEQVRWRARRRMWAKSGRGCCCGCLTVASVSPPLSLSLLPLLLFLLSLLLLLLCNIIISSRRWSPIAVGSSCISVGWCEVCQAPVRSHCVSQ